jgi:hypothetical protein
MFAGSWITEPDWEEANGLIRIMVKSSDSNLIYQ